MIEFNFLLKGSKLRASVYFASASAHLLALINAFPSSLYFSHFLALFKAF
jgi:hypothetical protein